MYRIRPERDGDVAARERLLDEACPERFTRPSQAVRTGREPARGLALVVEEAGEIVGTVRLWHVRAGSAGPALLLGPVAVAAHRRSEQVGSRLIETALRRARQYGHKAVVLVGDPAYYRRFGFDAGSTAGLILPDLAERHRLQGLELRPGALAGASGIIAGTGPILRRSRRGAWGEPAGTGAAVAVAA